MYTIYLITTIIRNKDIGVHEHTDTTCMYTYVHRHILMYVHTDRHTHKLTTSTERTYVLKDPLLPYHPVLLVTQVVAMVIMTRT